MKLNLWSLDQHKVASLANYSVVSQGEPDFFMENYSDKKTIRIGKMRRYMIWGLSEPDKFFALVFRKLQL